MRAMLAQDLSAQGAGLQEDGTDNPIDTVGKIKVSQSVAFGIHVRNASGSSQVQKYLVGVRIQLLIPFLFNILYIIVAVCGGGV